MPKMCISLTLAFLCIFMFDAVWSAQPYEIEMNSDNNQNDISWTLEEVYSNGSARFIDSGSGIANLLVTRLDAEDDTCLRYNITDSYGDGGGSVSVYYGDTAIVTRNPTLTFDNDAFSQRYLDSGKGPSTGHASHLIQRGSGVVGTVCEFADISDPATGCHESTAVDVVFVLDSASDLTVQCQNFYSDIIIDLVEHYLPRDDLKIAVITYGTDDRDFTKYESEFYRILSTPKTGAAKLGDLKPVIFGDGSGSWYTDLKPEIESIPSDHCIGGGHATIDAIFAATDIITEEYGAVYDLTRQQYIILLTNEYMDVEQYKNIYPCRWWQTVFDTNGINFILFSENAVNEHLECLKQRPENIVTLAQGIASMADSYTIVQDLVCNEGMKIAITEVFIDDNTNRYWFEIVNLGSPFNVSSLEFSGNVFVGSVDTADDEMINQGDIIVIGSMDGSIYSPCNIYGGDTWGSLMMDCSKYYSVSYDGGATLSSFLIGVNDIYGSVLTVTSADNFVISSGYSYQLWSPYSDFTTFSQLWYPNYANLSNWRESCYRYGSPGVLNFDYCPDVCDPDKCREHGDTTADCDESYSNLYPPGVTSCSDVTGVSITEFIGDWRPCAPSQCICDTSYYIDFNGTRSCILVEAVPYCYAYVTNAQTGAMIVNWTVSPYVGVDSYSIQYGDATQANAEQFTEVVYPDHLLYQIRMTAVGSDVSDDSTVESVETQCKYGYAPTRRPTLPGETWDPTATPTVSPVTTPGPTVSPTLSPTFAGCGSSLKLDLLFILDSSGSLWVSNSAGIDDASHYVNWFSQVDFCKTIVNESLPGDSHVGCIFFSGCGKGYKDNFDSCYATGDLGDLQWGLLDYGIPNDQEAVFNRFGAVGQSDFIQQFTWTRESLRMAMWEFNASSTDDRQKVIIMLTDGRPQPEGYNHQPCESEESSTGEWVVTYESPELIALRDMGVMILTVGIDLQTSYVNQWFNCLVEDPKHFFEVDNFEGLKNLTETIGELVCSSEIELMINEVGLWPNYGNDTSQHLFFIELYNPGVGVDMNGFIFKGMIEYKMTTESSGVHQGDYWVISTYNMTSVDQVDCKGCGQDLLISPDNADLSMDNDHWTVELYNTLGNLIDYVERDPIFFPLVKDYYTHELIWEHYDNELGSNWEESCYVYGTPQDPNQEPCPCEHLRCQQKGDKQAYCSDTNGDGSKDCLCSDEYILSGGVCVPVYTPGCCYNWQHDCDNSEMLLTWCAAGSSAVLQYRIYKDNVEFDTVSSTIFELSVAASCTNTPNFTVTTIFQSEPLIESAPIYCPPTEPTPSPSEDPSQSPTAPTKDPSRSPTTAQPTTRDPSAAPTPFGCDRLTIYVRDSAANPYPAGVIDLYGTYDVDSDTLSDSKWKYIKDKPTTADEVIEYKDEENSWVIRSGFAYLVFPTNDSGVAPPFLYQFDEINGWLNWTDTMTGRSLEIQLVCGEIFITPHPTGPPVTITQPPMPNCTQLWVTSISEPSGAPQLTDVILTLDTLLHDGKGLWSTSDNTFEMSWYDRRKRWSFYDITNGKFYLAPLEYSSYPEPRDETQPDDWTLIEDDSQVYSLQVLCENPPFNTTTPAPTSLICTFPDGIIQNWDLPSYLAEWDRCYYTTYSDGTTAPLLNDECLDAIKTEFNDDIDDVYLFVGAIKEDDTDKAILGSYAHISVLETKTDSEIYAYQTSTKFPQETYWYYVDNVAFGFTDIDRIDLSGGGCDTYDYSSDKALCWHLLNAQTGGWRAGKLTNLNDRNDIYKVIYYKQCNVTIELKLCATITVDSTDYADLTILKDYGVVNDYKSTWQDTPPGTNKYELGWMDVEKSWVLDTVAQDGKSWLYEDPNYDPDFPPFDELITWYNRDNSSDSIVLTLHCGEPHNETHAPSPPPQEACECIEITTDGLSAIEGAYNYSTDTSNDGGNYYRCDGTRLYYDNDLETWFIVGNGAYFELIQPFTPHATDPSELPPLGVPVTVQDRAQDTSIQTATIQFVCNAVGGCPCTTCVDYDYWEYVDGEIIYTSDTQMGFPVNVTNNEDGLLHVQDFERDFDEFLYSRRYDESILQLSISDYIVPGNTTLVRKLYPPNTIELVYDSLDNNTYRDSNTVGLWFQLSDAFESTYIDLTDVSVVGFARCPDCGSFAIQTTFNKTCNVSSVDEHSGFNWIKCEFAVDESLYIVNDTNTLELSAELYISDTKIATSNMIKLTLAPRIEAEGILYPGLYGEFAMSPRYATDEVRLTLWLNSDELFRKDSSAFRLRYAQAWWLSVTFDESIIEYISFIPDDELWGSIRSLYTVDDSNDNGEIEIWGSKIGMSLNTNGADIYVGYFVFEVIEGTIDDTYSNVLSFITLSMSGDNGYSITTNAEGLMADINGWSTAQASLVVIPDDPIHIWVQVDTNNLWNTAFISGIKVSLPFPIFVVYHFDTKIATSLSCDLDDWTAVSATTSGKSCIASATHAQTESGNSYIDITADGITSTQLIKVWLPLLSSFEIEPWNTGTKTVQTELKQVDMAYRAVGDIYYESLPLYVYCTFINQDIRSTGRVSVNEFLSFDQIVSDNDTIVEIVHWINTKQRHLIHGLASGSSIIRAVLETASREFASLSITVGGGIVSIENFGGVLVTHSEFVSLTHTVDVDHTANADDVNILTDLKQSLSNAGDIGSVHPFMKLSDGVLIDLTDEASIVYISTVPEYLKIIDVDKRNGENMGEAGAYTEVTAAAQQVAWSELVIWTWLHNMTDNGMVRTRGIGCIPGEINPVEPISVNVTLSCDTRVITVVEDPADYIFGIPTQCYLIVTVYWTDGTATDFSTDNRTVYDIITFNNLLTLDTNIVRANTSCEINTDFVAQNVDCYGFDTVGVSFQNYPALVNWTGSIEIEVVIFDRLRLISYPAPYFVNDSYEDPSILNLFDCADEYEQSKVRIYGNLTNGENKQLTDRNDVELNETVDLNVISVQNSLRLVSGLQNGESSIIATLTGSKVSDERVDYSSNIVDYVVSNDLVYLDSLVLYTFNDRDHVFEDLIHTRELLKMDATFSDGVIIRDILREMLNNSLWSSVSVSDVFTFISTDPQVVSVNENGVVEILDNWWREVNITVTSTCGDATARELIYPNLKPDLWDVDVEAPYTESGLQFQNQDTNPFVWNIYINATNGTLLSFSIRLWWDDNLFIENGTDECSYIYGVDAAEDSWPQCEAAGDWEGQMVSWNLDTVRGELRLAGASSTGSSTDSALQHVVTCNFRVGSTEQNISKVIGQVIEISYMDDEDNVIKHVYNQEIVAGDGYQQINDGQSIKTSFPSNIEERYSTERSIDYECDALTNDEYIFNDDPSGGCCGYALFGDVNYDCKQTAWDAQAITYFFVDTSALYPEGFNTRSLSDLQWSQRIAMDQSLDYLQDDRNECVNPTLDNPCTQGLEDTWYALQTSTGKFLYMNVTYREQTLVQDGRVVRAIAPMWIQEYSNLFRYATDLDCTVFFELKNVTKHNQPGFIKNNSLRIGQLIPFSEHGINDSIIIKGEYIEDKYWTFETKEYNWTDVDGCFEMAILYETFSEDDGIIHSYDGSDFVRTISKDNDERLNCTQIDREYAFRGSKFYGDSFIEFTILCLDKITNPPTLSPTPPPTQTPTACCRELELIDCRYEDHGTAILAYFNKDTNRGGFGGAPFSCYSTWNSKTFNKIEGITEDSRCIWKDFSTMRIELGYEFEMRPTYSTQSYTLELTGDKIRDYDEIEPPVRGYCFVYPMFNPPPVFASITGPTKLGPCDDLRLLATATVGQAAPMTWKWQIEGNALQSGCVLGSDLIADDEEILFVPKECLSAVSYDIFLTATNHYLENFDYSASQSKTDQTVIVYTQSKLPTIQLLTPSVINITTLQDLIVPTFVSVDSGGNCDADDVVYDLDLFTFKWSPLEFGDLTDSDTNSNPFGSTFAFDTKNIVDNSNNIVRDNYVYFELSTDDDLEDSSATLIIPGTKFDAGKYYGFRLEVTYTTAGVTNEAYVGVIVNLPIPYARPSIMYQSIRAGSDISIDINSLYDFYDVDASQYGIRWNCSYANSGQSVLYDADAFDDLTVIVINELNANLESNNTYNCSAEVRSLERNTLDMVWGRRESYYVFEYISAEKVIDSKQISVHLSTNIGIISRNKRIVISASFEDYYREKTTADDGLYFDSYTFEWFNFGENHDLADNVYGISVISHIDYENGHSVNFVVDDEVGRFIHDGEKYGFELVVTSPDGYSGFGQIELIANRGPNGGTCLVELMANHSKLYRVECYGWTDEYMEIPLEYNFMLLDSCRSDSDCKNELICDVESSEYDVGVCVLSTVGAVHNYLREWTQGNMNYFQMKCDVDGGKKYILRSFIREFSGFVTTFDTPFTTVADDDISDRDALIDTFLSELTAAESKQTVTGFAQYVNAYDTLMDCKGGYDRTDVVNEIEALYEQLAANDVNNLLDRHYDLNKIISTQMDALFFDFEQFLDTNLETKTSAKPSENVALRIFKIINDMSDFYSKRDGSQMIARDLSVYQLVAMTWAGDAALEQENLYESTDNEKYFTKFKRLYSKYVWEINALGLIGRLVDETHYNVSYDGLLVLSGWETKAKLFSDESDCGGDLIDIAQDFESSYFGGTQVDYVKCQLVAFNGGMLRPSAISAYMSSPIIAFDLRGFLADGTEVVNGRRRRAMSRRLTEFGKCSPFLYTIPHNPDTNLLDYQTRRGLVDKQSYVTWSVCKSILGTSNETTSSSSQYDSYSDRQAPTAEDCYVLTHDEEKTVCACNSNYTLLAVEEELYVPHFIATLNRYDPAWSWTGLMESVGAMLIVLILLFVFTFAFYILPSYDKHKALLAVKKGLPKSQREGAYFQTGEGKVYRAARINMNRMSFCQVYCEVYKIRLRNDHLCLWWCCDDPGSNISHFIKVLLTLFYTLLFMWQIAYFYGREWETTFADTLMAFLIAFETILPIWLCAWCISKIRPHEFTDEEIDELVDEQMPIITKDQKWEDEYESDIEAGGDEEYEEKDDVEGLFAVPEILPGTERERQSNWDILRIYTDIDEEVEYLEENYMPIEGKWNKKKRRNYPLDKVGYVALDDDGDDDESSIDSYEERRGFEGQNAISHWDPARDAVQLGFVPVNEEEEYDAAASKMLRENQKENIKQRRHEREGSISSKISSLFRKNPNRDDSSQKKKKKKKEKKRRRSSLMQLLTSIGSKKDVIDDHDEDVEAKQEKKSYKKVSKEQEQDEYEDDEDEYEDEQEDEQDDEYTDDDDGDEQYYDDDDQEEEEEESETSSEKRRRKKKEKKRKKHKKERKKHGKPAVASMDAPRPMQGQRGAEIEMEEFDESTTEIGEFMAVHLNASRKHAQFNKILQIARLNRQKIKKNPQLLSRIVSAAVASGDSSLSGSEALVQRASSLIKQKHPLFDEIESGATNENQKRIQKLLRKQDVINTVFAGVDGARDGGSKGKFAYSPAELRKLEELPERAPSQRPQHEKKTNIDDDVWHQSNLVYDERALIGEDKKNNNENKTGRGIDMDDIWEVTGALPPELLSALEDPYDPWKEDELKPVQKPLREEEEEGYRDKLTAHFKKRRELLKRKYWLPRWCRYVVWILLLAMIIVFLILFLKEGNKLGANFLWIPQKFNNTECTISISEQQRFDYDFSLDESVRRNPDCSPQEYQGSMPHCWDYRNRFTISSIITMLTSVLLVQPLYIAILALVAVTCLPVCKPGCIAIRNCCCGFKKDDPGYKHFLGGTILISGDTNLEYGQLADEELTQVEDGDDEYDDDDDGDGRQGRTNDGDTKKTPLLS